jgi:hypothetical protein
MMTAAEWQAGEDPEAMLGFVAGKASERKLRLFAVACCRRAPWLGGDAARRAWEAAERYADGEVGAEELWQAFGLLPDGPGRQVAIPRKFDFHAARSVSRWAAPHPELTEAEEEEIDLTPPEATAERQLLCALLRDLIGDPFRPVSLSPLCRTPTVVSLAEAAYEHRILPTAELDPARLAILADALEEAGCADPTILEHLRGPGPHVRGCFAVDLALGRS